jgi:hypothetical protein
MARLQQKSRRQSPQVRAEQPAFPARWLYGLYVVSSVTMLGCHRRPRDARGVFANLAPASERQDHTTSPYVADVIRLLTRRVHRIPQPTFVTIAKRPSARSRDARQGACDLPDKASALPAACWRDGQITHDAHARAARRAIPQCVAPTTSDAEQKRRDTVGKYVDPQRRRPRQRSPEILAVDHGQRNGQRVKILEQPRVHTNFHFLEVRLAGRPVR